MVHKFVLANPNKSILSITYSFYLNATREKGEIIVILLIVEVLKQSPLFGHLTEYFIFCLLMVCVNLYYILIAKLHWNYIKYTFYQSDLHIRQNI